MTPPEVRDWVAVMSSSEIPICTQEPCWGLWLYWILQAAKSPFGIALFAAGLAWWYQRMNKIVEYRFETLQKAATLFFKADMAAHDYMLDLWRVEHPGMYATMLGEQLPPAAAETRRQKLIGCISDLDSLSDIIGEVFDKRVRANWTEITHNMYSAVGFTVDLSLPKTPSGPFESVFGSPLSRTPYVN